MDAGPGHSGGRARFGRLLAGGLGAGHHQPGPAALRPVFRAVSSQNSIKSFTF